jgi:predicted MFS family arabinose efflux permease
VSDHGDEPPVRSDLRWIYLAQGGRAFGYGLAAVLLGSTLAASGLNPTQVGLLLAAIVVGSVGASLTVGALADRVGRRRTYVTLFLLLAVTGSVYAATTSWPLLIAAGLLGVLSTEVVESGPFTTVEQAILATLMPNPKPLVTGLGRYNAAAAAAGSLGALSAATPALVRHLWPGAPTDRHYFVALVLVALFGGYATSRLSPAVESARPGRYRPTDGRTRHPTVPVVWRLAGLFAVDSFAGGFTLQTFLVYWLEHRYGASAATTGLVMFALGALQTLSFLAAPAIAHRIGLLSTMVFTHLPSNVLLAAVGFAPNLAAAIGLLLARTALSQMDVPTRQAYVMMLVPPDQRTYAAAITNTARYLTRPVGTALLGPLQLLAPALPFLAAGAIKSGYDLSLWAWFRRVDLPGSQPVRDPQIPAPHPEATDEMGHPPTSEDRPDRLPLAHPTVHRPRC